MSIGGPNGTWMELGWVDRQGNRIPSDGGQRIIRSSNCPGRGLALGRAQRAASCDLGPTAERRVVSSSFLPYDAQHRC